METLYDNAPAVDRRAVRGVFSRVGFASLLFLCANVGTGAAVALLLPNMPADLRTLLTYVLLYALGTGVFYLAVRGAPCEKAERTVIPFSSFLVYLCIGYFFLIAGNLIGLGVTRALGADSAVDAFFLDTSIWVTILPTVILVPVCEELMFRKLILDRTAVYGKREAVLLSALLFALMHGNLSQVFYAFGLGLVLGMLYLNTRNLWYTIALHAFVNLMQGALPAFLGQLPGADSPVYTLLISQLAVMAFALAVAGLVLFLRRKKMLLPPKSGIPGLGALAYGNAGVILFFLASAAVFVSITLTLIA